MSRDRHDTLTLDLFSPLNIWAQTVGGLASSLEKATQLIARVAAYRDQLPRFTEFAIAATGPLSEDEKDRIFELAEQGLAAWTIARKIGRHPSTVSWNLTALGYRRLSHTKKQPFWRKGQLVVPFTDREDAYMKRRSGEGAIPAQICREMNQIFPHPEKPRSRDTISCRLMMLASDEAAREAA